MQDKEGGVILTVHVQPNSSRTECVGIHDDALKIRVAARPVDGAANDELIRFLADRCAVRRQHVRILAGTQARRKRVYVKGITTEVMVARLLSQQGKESQ